MVFSNIQENIDFVATRKDTNIKNQKRFLLLESAFGFFGLDPQ